MPELARRIASRLRQFVGERRRARRVSVSLPVKVSRPVRGNRSNGAKRETIIEGHTLDMSATGLGLVLPAIRVADYYLTGEDRRLWLKLDLPEGDVEMEVAPVRYESLDEHKTEHGYLIGVRITEISQEHQAAYVLQIAKFLKEGHPRTPRY
jgi:c-di-GMP-binding flagellar brake protein YcgR